MTGGTDGSGGPVLAVDHLVYAAPSLDAGIDTIRARLGVEAVPSGRHRRWRTRNALVGLGPTAYLEIIGPDDGPQGTGESGDGSGEDATTRPFGIDALASPCLATWAARATPLETAVRAARSVGFDPGPVMEGSRETSDGSVVRWRLTDPEAARDGGALPFLIDWGRSPHPAESLDHACRLGELRLRHPEPDRIRPFLDTLRPRVVLHPGPEPAISAHLDTPVGRVVLG
ncbi:MAG: VOC family protein [Longimicrobiales bacterium]